MTTSNNAVQVADEARKDITSVLVNGSKLLHNLWDPRNFIEDGRITEIARQATDLIKIQIHELLQEYGEDVVRAAAKDLGFTPNGYADFSINLLLFEAGLEEEVTA
jgi:hypothetical protein